MDDEIEDIVGKVKYTDSQNSVTTTAVYSLDFTDSSSEKNNSSGKETYVIEYDSDDSDKTFQLYKSKSIVDLIDKCQTTNVIQVKRNLNEPLHSIDRAVCTGLSICNIIAQEIFTQTSKTIIELAQNDVNNSPRNKTLETQTSFVSITENKSVEYKLHILTTNRNNKNMMKDTEFIDKTLLKPNTRSTNSTKFENKSIILRELEREENIDIKSIDDLDQDTIYFIDDDLRDSSGNKMFNKIQVNNTSEYESTCNDSDFDDSLMDNEYSERKNKNRGEASETSEQSATDNDVDELYNRLIESPQLLSPISSVEPAVRNFEVLTPLTEETVQRQNSIVDLTLSAQTLTTNRTNELYSNNALLIDNSGVRVTVLSDNDYSTEDCKSFKLPPINKNPSCPNSPHLNFLFTLNKNPIEDACVLPSLNKRQYKKNFDRWEIDTKELASGESPHINSKTDSQKIFQNSIHLPSIPLKGFTGDVNSEKYITKIMTPLKQSSVNDSFDTISIQGKIKELKTSARKTRPKFSSRSGSPTSMSSPDESKSCDEAEKGCDLLCIELLRHLRSSSWVEITETLVDLPKSLEKFWSIVTENRIADFLRQVTGHIDSPRTQVARAACKTLADILKNTNYTKKPEFYECMSTLLSKTGSYNRPVRREANVALDDIVCTVDVTHCVTAICVYGVGHKSVLVRCASARLLVVCSALAEGGRQILRMRPPSAAAARKHALRSLSELLQDKNTDTRKYAERLYAILRPLPNFEAYFLTDVDVELASKQMKKYDQLLVNSRNR